MKARQKSKISEKRWFSSGMWLGYAGTVSLISSGSETYKLIVIGGGIETKVALKFLPPHLCQN